MRLWLLILTCFHEILKSLQPWNEGTLVAPYFPAASLKDESFGKHGKDQSNCFDVFYRKLGWIWKRWGKCCYFLLEWQADMTGAVIQGSEQTAARTRAQELIPLMEFRSGCWWTRQTNTHVCYSRMNRMSHRERDSLFHRRAVCALWVWWGIVAPLAHGLFYKALTIPSQRAVALPH